MRVLPVLLVGGPGPAASTGSILTALLSVTGFFATRPVSAAPVGGGRTLTTPTIVV